MRESEFYLLFEGKYRRKSPLSPVSSIGIASSLCVKNIVRMISSMDLNFSHHVIMYCSIDSQSGASY
jgi:hypothetical protein